MLSVIIFVRDGGGVISGRVTNFNKIKSQGTDRKTVTQTITFICSSCTNLETNCYRPWYHIQYNL